MGEFVRRVVPGVVPGVDGVAGRELLEIPGVIPGAGAMGLEVPGAGALPGGSLPGAGAGVRVRAGVEGDLAWMDRLQKVHRKAVGWMPMGQLRGHVEKGNVWVAEVGGDLGAGEWAVGGGDMGGGDMGAGEWAVGGGERQTRGVDGVGFASAPNSQRPAANSQQPTPNCQPPTPIAYVIGVDRYFKREDVGAVYQLNVEPGWQRGLVGARLLAAMFDRWPYGVRLCGCWCAQDLPANRFWEAMGFVPLAFRTGGRGKTSAADLAAGRFKGRVHIYWQKAVRREDRDGRGPRFKGWWYPSQTGGGAIREDRLVLPIPPGMHWSDAKPTVLPGVGRVLGEVAAEREAAAQLSGPEVEAARLAARQRRAAEREAKRRAAAAAAARAETVAVGGLRFGPPPPPEAAPPEAAIPGAGALPGAGAGVVKNDPRLVALARELRDRWLEEVEARPELIGPGEGHRYRLGKQVQRGSVAGGGEAGWIEAA